MLAEPQRRTIENQLWEMKRTIARLEEQGKGIFPFDLTYYGKCCVYRYQLEQALIQEQAATPEPPQAKGGE